MKKLLFATMVAMLSLVNVNAQEKGEGKGFANGDTYVSGTLSYVSTSYDGESTNQFDFIPTVGFFVSDNIAIEALLVIGSVKDTYSTFGGGLGANYYFTPGKRFSFTTGASLSYVGLEYEGADYKVNTFGIAVVPGVNYFISESFALRASMGALSYSSTKADVDGAEATNNFALNLNLSDVNFGLTYKF